MIIHADLITYGLPSLLVGLIIGALAIFLIPVFKIRKANKASRKILRDAEIKAEHIIKNAQLDGKQAIFEMKQEADKEIKEKKQEIAVQENKLIQREQSIDRRDSALLQKENTLDEKSENLTRRLKEVDKKETFLQAKIDGIITELEKVAQMSTQEARDELFSRVESKISKELAAFVKNK